MNPLRPKTYLPFLGIPVRGGSHFNWFPKNGELFFIGPMKLVITSVNVCLIAKALPTRIKNTNDFLRPFKQRGLWIWRGGEGRLICPFDMY
jgi:hypothetical protein